ARVATVAEPVDRSHSLHLALPDDDAGTGERLAARAVDQGATDEYRLHLVAPPLEAVRSLTRPCADQWPPAAYRSRFRAKRAWQRGKVGCTFQPFDGGR